MNLIELLLSLELITAEQAEGLRLVVEADDLAGVDAGVLTECADVLHEVANVIIDDGLGDESEATDDHVSTLREIAEALTGISAEQATRDEATAARRAELAELAEQLRGEADEIEDEADEAETVEIEASDDDDDEDEDGGDDVGDPVASDDAPDGETVDEPEPVMASAPRVSRVAARRPTRFAPQPKVQTVFEMTDNVADWGLVASANAHIGPRKIRDEADLAEVIVEALRAGAGFQGASSRVRLASMGPGWEGVAAAYGDDRSLGNDAVGNMAKIRRAQQHLQKASGGDALVAAGGNPAPEEVRYDIPVMGTENRPIRDQFLTRFAATRGGVRVIAPPRLADLDDATSVHTDANDIAGASKSFATVTAGAESESTQLVDAIVKRVRFGNFADRFLPELVAAWVKLAAVSHARLAEQTLITSIDSASTAVQAGDDILSATRDILAQLDRLCMGVRSRERLGHDFVFSALLPDWVYNLVRTDLSRQAPGGGTVNDETLAVADASIDRFFATRNIRPVWTPDLQVFGEQGAGTIHGFPDSVTAYVAAPGAHLFLDGGQLNLGTVRDSALTDTNDAEMFAETFEQHIFNHQVPAYKATLDVDPSGTTSAAAAFDPSVTGS